MTGTTIDAAAADRLLRAQWLRLREWLEDVDADGAAAPSVLPGWTVADLVAHVGRSVDALAACQPAPEGTGPQPLARYLAGYQDRAGRIDEVTRGLAAEIAEEPLRALDRFADDAFAQLHVLRALGPDPVVQGRGGPIRLSDMVLTRLIELVVHGDDLDRSLPHHPGDVLVDDAVAVVSDVLLRVVTEHGGWALEVVDPRCWVRLATGRVGLDEDSVTRAIRLVHTSDSMPDLRDVLPVL